MFSGMEQGTVLRSGIPHPTGRLPRHAVAGCKSVREPLCLPEETIGLEELFREAFAERKY